MDLNSYEAIRKHVTFKNQIGKLGIKVTAEHVLF